MTVLRFSVGRWFKLDQNSIVGDKFTLGSLETVEVPIKTITERVPDTPSDISTIRGMVKTLENGMELDPILIRRDPDNPEKWVVTDGNHRLLAHKL